jgi:hypothetical protein
MSEPTLESLKAEGAERHDPARFHYLEALARRMQGQPPAVEQRLRQRLQAALADYAARATAAPPATTPPAPARAADSPLARLNRDLAARARADAQEALSGEGANLSEMKSVRQFSEVWSRISAEQQVAQALHQGPENAGPLNSHKLVLRSLGLMRSLSPDYLRRFMAQMDALLWLEQANRPAPRAARPAARNRR